MYINSFSQPYQTSTNLTEAKNFIENESMNLRGITKSVSLKEKKALEFLTANYNSYDMNLALVTCQLHNFKVKFCYS